MPNDRISSHREVGSLLDRLVFRARLALTWERLWPRLVPLLCLGGLFLIVSFLGLWINVPRWARVAGLSVFGLAFLACLVPFRLFRLPERSSALSRIDRDSGLAHRPASTLADDLANADADPDTRAMWRLHVRRAGETASSLKVGLPSPRVALLDRYAVRAGVLAAVVAAAFVAGPEKNARLLAAFDWRTEGSVNQGFRMDAWIDPPAYTGRPPLMLRAKTDEGVKEAIEQSVRAPVGSFVIVRASDGAGVVAEVKGLLVAPEKPKAAEKTDGASKDAASSKPIETAARAPRGISNTQSGSDQVNRWQLKGDGTLVLRRLGRVVASYEITSIPDKAPEIALVGEPRNNVRGSMTLRYKLKDDYGILSAEAVFRARVSTGARCRDGPFSDRQKCCSDCPPLQVVLAMPRQQRISLIIPGPALRWP